MFCRWLDLSNDTWVAAKHVSCASTARRELAALNLANSYGVPRVVKIKEILQHPSEGKVLILE